MKWSEMVDFSSPEVVKNIKVKITVEMTNTVTAIHCKAEEMTIHLGWNPYTKEITFNKPLEVESVVLEEND